MLCIICDYFRCQMHSCLKSNQNHWFQNQCKTNIQLIINLECNWHLKSHIFTLRLRMHSRSSSHFFRETLLSYPWWYRYWQWYSYPWWYKTTHGGTTTMVVQLPIPTLRMLTVPLRQYPPPLRLLTAPLRQECCTIQTIQQ